VTVKISGGKGTLPVPDVVGQSQENAEQALQTLGFKTSVKTAFSDTVPEGDVISVSPAAGKQATKGRTITLTVSKGKEGVAVPGVVGSNVNDATQTIMNAGLSSVVTEKYDKNPPGTVFGQNPPEGTTIAPGGTVQLTVAKARPNVPDVTNGNPTVEQATQTLEDAGYKVKVTERDDPNNVGKVIGQSPAPNTPRSTGGTVTIAVGRDPAAAATPTATPTP
jgi:serine/threonine-protein kinase